MTELQKEIILTFALCDMNVSKTARKLYIHRNTVMFHFDKVKEKTGLDPHNFYDLIALVKMAKKGEKDD
jgi:DNA-binding PucR family transcriptional regulator